MVVIIEEVDACRRGGEASSGWSRVAAGDELEWGSAGAVDEPEWGAAGDVGGRLEAAAASGAGAKGAVEVVDVVASLVRSARDTLLP